MFFVFDVHRGGKKGVQCKNTPIADGFQCAEIAVVALQQIYQLKFKEVNKIYQAYLVRLLVCPLCLLFPCGAVDGCCNVVVSG